MNKTWAESRNAYWGDHASLVPKTTPHYPIYSPSSEAAEGRPMKREENRETHKGMGEKGKEKALDNSRERKEKGGKSAET